MIDSIILDLDEVIQLYQEEFREIGGVKYEFIREKEGKIIDHKISNAYSHRFSRENYWYIKDDKDNYYEAMVMEYAEHINNLSLEGNGDIVFDLLKKKITKQKNIK